MPFIGGVLADKIGNKYIVFIAMIINLIGSIFFYLGVVKIKYL